MAAGRHLGGGGIQIPMGIVKWFDEAKGYGLIAPIDGGADALLPMAALRLAGLLLVVAHLAAFRGVRERKGYKVA
jgi:cold shock CspA family protein